MALANATPFAALGTPLVDPDGVEVVLAVVKATFRRRAEARGALALALSDEQLPVRAGDIAHFPDAPDSSVRYPADIASRKRGADVVVLGDAVARVPSKQVDVAVQVGERRVPLRVHGERVFYRGVGGIAIGPAAAFERKPIVYERAWGGTDGGVVERRNPVGRGIAKNASALVGTPAPQIEHPDHPITSASDRPEPVGYGALAPHWSPRCERAGTFDETWRRTRLPRMPLDYDDAHANVAHPSLVFAEGLAAGTPVAIANMTPEGLWRFALPPIRLRLDGLLDDGSVVTVRPAIDTVLVEVTPGIVELTARHAFRHGRGRTLLREIRVDLDG